MFPTVGYHLRNAQVGEQVKGMKLALVRASF